MPDADVDTFLDLFDKVLCPNPARDLRARYDEKAGRWRAVGPDLRMLPWRAT